MKVSNEKISVQQGEITLSDVLEVEFHERDVYIKTAHLTFWLDTEKHSITVLDPLDGKSLNAIHLKSIITRAKSKEIK